MKLLTTKSTRFAEVVARSGQPVVHTLWVKPTQDRRFQMLLRNDRVMTILQNENGRDFGLVGFKEQKGARFLAFEKSLKAFHDHRIVGIKWDLLGS